MHTAGTVVALVSSVVGAILAFWSIGDLRPVRTLLGTFGNEFTLSIILTSAGTLAVILIMIKTLQAELIAYFVKSRSFGEKILEETDKKVVVDK